MRNVIFAIFVIGAVLFAQGVQPANPFASIFSPNAEKNIKNGAWTLYEMTTSDNAESGKMKFSVVGQDKCDGEDCFWFEMEMWDGDDHTIMKFLSKGDMSTGNKKYSSVIIKHNDEPAYEFVAPQDTSEYSNMIPPGVDEEEYKEARDSRKRNVEDDRFEVKESKETITVPAGTFNCTRYTTIDKETNEKNDVWVSDKVPLLGVVKMKNDDGEFVLADYGDNGAKSAITETPQKIDFKSMWEQQMKEAMEEEEQEKKDEAVDDAIKGGLKSIFGK
ncbi:hypothetical protein J7M00_05165 [bacterium]|nr:hypothetical protein [bacterium]